MNIEWSRVRRLVGAIATKRGVILTLVVVASSLGAGLAILQDDPTDESSAIDTTTTGAADEGTSETSTVDSGTTTLTSTPQAEDSSTEPDGVTSPETTTVTETTTTASETTTVTGTEDRTTGEDTDITFVATDDEEPELEASVESNVSAS